MSTEPSKTTDRPSGCVAVWQPGEKPDPGTMHWLAPDGTRWPATDREQAENAALVRSMRLTAETRGGEPTPSKATAMTARELIAILERLPPDTQIYGDGRPTDDVFPVTRAKPIKFICYDDSRDDDVEYEGICLS